MPFSCDYIILGIKNNELLTCNILKEFTFFFFFYWLSFFDISNFYQFTPKNLTCWDFWGSLYNFIHISKRRGSEEVPTLRPAELLIVKAVRIRTWKQT